MGCGIRHLISDLAQLFFMVLIVRCWEADHVIPLTVFNFTKPENKAKSDEFDKPFQPSLPM